MALAPGACYWTKSQAVVGTGWLARPLSQHLSAPPTLFRENSKLADALAALTAASESNTAQAVENARKEERKAAEERLQAALEAERQKQQSRDRWAQAGRASKQARRMPGWQGGG